MTGRDRIRVSAETRPAPPTEAPPTPSSVQDRFAERFSARIAVDPVTGCHVWTGSRDRDGYGRFREAGVEVRAHRAAWEAANGRAIPRGLVVRHACDDPRCVNPNHLSLGRQQDNVRDRDRRDRQAKGSRNGRSKLIEADAVAIKGLLREGGFSASMIAGRFGVSHWVVRDIAKGKTWRHVG